MGYTLKYCPRTGRNRVFAGYFPSTREIPAPPSRAQGAGERPGLLAERARHAAELVGVAARGGAVDRTLGDPLRDRRHPEQAVDHIEFPIWRPAAPGPRGIG